MSLHSMPESSSSALSALSVKIASPVISNETERISWISHKTAEIQSANDHINIVGEIALQSLRRSRVRLLFAEYNVTRLGQKNRQSSSSIPISSAELHVYGLTQNKTKCLDEIRQHRALYLGRIQNSQDSAFHPQEVAIQVACPMSEAIEIVSVVIVMQHGEFDPEVLIARGDFVAGSSLFRGDKDDLVDADTTSDCTYLAIAALNINEPLQESTIRLYASAAKRFLQNLDISESSKVDFDAFKQGLELMGILIMEHRAKSLFNACDEQSLKLLDLFDLELCLMMNDACPTTTEQVTNLYEVFSSFDIENTEHLSFRQFQECISTPGLKSSFKVMDLGTLHYLFRKFAGGETIDYTSFIMLWSRYFIDPEYEMNRRNLHDELKISRRAIEFVIPFLKNRRRQNHLYETVKKDFYDASKFILVKKKIIQMRKKAQALSDERRRSAKRIGRRQKRESVINDARRDQSGGAFLTSVSNRRKDYYLSRRRNAIHKIHSDCTMDAIEEKEAIIAKRREKATREEQIIGVTCSDRLEFTGGSFDEIPNGLYDNKTSQMQLMDVKVFDFSRNGLKILPPMNLFFHLTSIRKLALSHNNLQSLPEELGALKRLEILLIDHNNMNELPASIGKLESLRVLNVSGNKLSELTLDFSSLQKLRIIEAHSNLINVLSRDIHKLTKLESLDISNNRLSTLPSELFALEGLFKLNVASNRLSDLPQSFGGLSSLVELDLSCNEIQELPESIKRIISLKLINLDDNKLMLVPGSVQGMRRLVSFSCQRNEVFAISQQIGCMESVEYFSCIMNNIQEIPHEIGLLKRLLFLKLQHNAIEVVPEEIGALVHLQRLDLSHNKINIIPHEFCLITSLLWLDLSYNKIEIFPENFGTLASLQTLDASHNRISALPPSFQCLKCLEELYLSSNRFKSLDPILCIHLPLKILHFEANRIKHLPPEVCKMMQLEELNLRHNDIRSIPLDLPKHTHPSGQQILLDLSQNPLSDLPTKFASSEANRSHQNPSGWELNEVYDWINEEDMIYKPAVDEWIVKKDSYLSGYLVFEDFFNGVLLRCENLIFNKKIDNLAYAILLKNKKYSDRLKQFFFYCKKHGHPRMYEQLNTQAHDLRERESAEREKVRIQRSLDAKDADMDRRSQEHDRYLENVSERCSKAKIRMSQVEEHRRMKEHKENDILQAKVKSKMEDKDKIDLGIEVERALQSAREAEELAELSFQSHVNKNRLLPVQIDPCWKPYNLKNSF